MYLRSQPSAAYLLSCSSSPYSLTGVSIVVSKNRTTVVAFMRRVALAGFFGTYLLTGAFSQTWYAIFDTGFHDVDPLCSFLCYWSGMESTTRSGRASSSPGVTSHFLPRLLIPFSLSDVHPPSCPTSQKTCRASLVSTKVRWVSFHGPTPPRRIPKPPRSSFALSLRKITPH